MWSTLLDPQVKQMSFEVSADHIWKGIREILVLSEAHDYRLIWSCLRSQGSGKTVALGGRRDTHPEIQASKQWPTKGPFERPFVGWCVPSARLRLQNCS